MVRNGIGKGAGGGGGGGGGVSFQIFLQKTGVQVFPRKRQGMVK